MKIAIVTHNAIRNDGQGRVTYELAHYLGRRHEVHLFVNRVDADLALLPGIVVHHVPVLQATNLIKGITFAVALRFQLRSQSFDIVHNNGDAGLVASDVNTCHFCHSAASLALYVRPDEREPLGRIYHAFSTAMHARLERWAFRRSRRVVAVSNLTANQLVQRARVPQERVIVVYDGVDPTEFVPVPRNAPEGHAPLRILFAGDLRIPRKGVEILLRAFLQLTVPATLSLVGDTTQSPYPAHVHQLPVSVRDRITFLGFRRDMPWVFAQHDLFVFPSQQDPFSLVTLEAMATGLPVIVSSTSGVSDLIEDGRSGFILRDPADHAGLAMLIDTIAGDAARREAMGVAARATALHYTWERMAQRVEWLYEELLGEDR